MKNLTSLFLSVTFVTIAILASANTCGADANTTPIQPESVTTKTRAGEVVECLCWSNPHAETIWEEIIQASERLSLQPRMVNVDATQAEGQLEAFGLRYMPNAYAQYQEVRAKALELAQTVKETFPKGADSDPTGGVLFAKANKKLAEATARSFRRRDELCFFLLYHQTGYFSEDELAEYDSRPIAIHLEEESADWPDDTPTADTALVPEDATFAAKYLSETHAGYQRLCGLFEDGAKQYADLRQTALALDAPRAHLEFGMLQTRLMEIEAALRQYKQDISVQRLDHSLGDTSADSLVALDHANAVKIQEFEHTMELKTYVARVARRLIVTLPGGVPMEMVWCPPGTFMMGSPENEKGRNDDETLHQVTLTKGFWMARTEVTRKQWESVMGRTSSSCPVGDNLPVGKEGRWIWNEPSGDWRKKVEVENIPWGAALVFCRKTGLRLPTEAEWEYACRAGSTGPYAGSGRLKDMAWDEHPYDGPYPVGQKAANAWGLKDMHGNVWEWCSDWYGAYSRNAVTDPLGPKMSIYGDQDNEDGTYRVIRGGAGHPCRSAERHMYESLGKHHLPIGFRPVAQQDLSNRDANGEKELAPRKRDQPQNHEKSSPPDLSASEKEFSRYIRIMALKPQPGEDEVHLSRLESVFGIQFGKPYTVSKPVEQNKSGAWVYEFEPSGSFMDCTDFRVFTTAASKQTFMIRVAFQGGGDSECQKQYDQFRQLIERVTGQEFHDGNGDGRDKSVILTLGKYRIDVEKYWHDNLVFLDFIDIEGYLQNQREQQALKPQRTCLFL